MMMRKRGLEVRPCLHVFNVSFAHFSKMHPTDSMCVIFQACLAEVVSTRRFSFSYVPFYSTLVPICHPTFLMPSCFYFVSFVAPRTGGAPFTPRFRPNASKMKCDHHTRAGEDRFDERIGIFYPSGAYTLFLIS